MDPGSSLCSARDDRKQFGQNETVVPAKARSAAEPGSSRAERRGATDRISGRRHLKRGVVPDADDRAGLIRIDR